MTLTNPWRGLPKKPPYILPEDARAIAEFQRRFPNEIIDDSLPEPYIGDVLRARVLILGLNPGHRDDDKIWHSRPTFGERWRRSLLFRSSSFPFYPLDPELANSPVAQWWNARLGDFIQHVGVHKLAKTIAAIEWFPYHSRKANKTIRFFSKRPSLPSQRFSFGVLQKAIGDCNKVVIALWGEQARRLWCASLGLPEADLRRMIRLNSHQSPYLTERNMARSDFSRIVEVLRQ
jgi:hypothetical protein